MSRPRTTHGMYKSKEYEVWQNMLARCYQPSCINFHRYGGRGIKVCDRWKTFINFFEDMGRVPPGLQLDRKNNDGDYCKDNCKWSTKEENCNNTSKSRHIEIDGVSLSVRQWARRLGIDHSTFLLRVKRWPKERWAEPRQEAFVR